MGAAPGALVGSVVEYVAICVLPAGVLALAFSRRTFRTVRAVGRRLHLLAEPAPYVARPPIERVAADLRRLRHEVDTLPDDLPMVYLLERAGLSSHPAA